MSQSSSPFEHAAHAAHEAAQAEQRESFGVYAEAHPAYAGNGYPSITLYTARGDSMFGDSLSAYWSLTLDEALALGTSLIEAVGQAKALSEQTLGKTFDRETKTTRRSL